MKFQISISKKIKLKVEMIPYYFPQKDVHTPKCTPQIYYRRANESFLKLEISIDIKVELWV